VTAATACPRPGCDGDIEDGFCDSCGRVLPASGPGTAASGPATAASGPATAASGPATAASGPATAASGPATAGARAGATGPSGPRRTGWSRVGSRRQIGGGLVEIAAEPEIDPADAVLTDPRVPESSRFCGTCDAPVGRGREDRPGRTEGFCSSCGARFSFSPALTAGDLVAGQYEVLGALAHGGLGWVYLARDRKVRDRWVVLKGVLNPNDAAALAAADAEQGFLALLVHPKIVRIYNIVTGDTDASTYIVMEYVGGRSLRQMRDPWTPMPPEHALAYVLEVLPALAHMHERGLIYCDFKPDNVVQTGTEVKLIDLGAVRRADDPGGDVWGTVGYQAPEIAAGSAEPSVASDLYTVGRALAVLTLTFDYHRTMRDCLPDPTDAPVLREHEPLHRLLRRTTDPDPTRRFASVEELSEQITGVLRGVVAGAGTTPPPRLSSTFEVARGSAGTTVDAPPTPAELAATLPRPLPDPWDSATPVLTAADAHGPGAVLAAARGLDTAQTRLSVALAHLQRGDTGAARVALDTHGVPHDWSWTWVALLLAATTDDVAGAHRAADEVCDALPGELPPQVASAALAETAGERALAGRRWERIWRTDPTWIAAAFGLARVRHAEGDRDAAIAVLDEVPTTSVHRADAQVAAVRLLLAAIPTTGTPTTGTPTAGTPTALPDWPSLVDAGRRLDDTDLDPVRRAELESEVLEWARAVRARGGTSPTGDEELLGCALDDAGLARGIEARYRLRARFSSSMRARFALVDRANDARPWTRR